MKLIRSIVISFIAIFSFQVKSYENPDKLLEQYIVKNIETIAEIAQSQDLAFGVRTSEIVVLDCMAYISMMNNVVGTCHIRDELAIKAINIYDNESYNIGINISLVTTIP